MAKDKNPLQISEVKHLTVWVWGRMLRQSRNFVWLKGGFLEDEDAFLKSESLTMRMSGKAIRN